MIIPSSGFPQTGGTTNNVPTMATYTFDPNESAGVSNNYGIVAFADVVSGASINGLGTPVALGNTSTDIDGLIIHATGGALRAYRVNLYLNANATPVCANIPITCSPNNIGKINLPIRIPANTAITADCSTSAASSNLRMAPIAYKTSPVSPVTSISGLGAATAAASQGVTLNTTSTWTLVGTLASAGKGIAVAHVGTNNDFGRTAGAAIVDIGISTGAGSTADTVLIPNIYMTESINNVFFQERGPFFMDLPSGYKIWARVRRTDGNIIDFFNVQVAVMY